VHETDQTAPTNEETDNALVDAVLRASRALVAVAARSLTGLAEEVTLPQYRVLVLVAQQPRRAVDLATVLNIAPSTGSRMCDRLVRKGLLQRSQATEDRRSVSLTLTEEGVHLLAQVTRRRRMEIAAIVKALSSSERDAVVGALDAFAEAAGEAPDQDWSLGWRLDEEGTA
jgi:DNA-binding MarR family transcriptional regulator